MSKRGRKKVEKSNKKWKTSRQVNQIRNILMKQKKCLMKQFDMKFYKFIPEHREAYNLSIPIKSINEFSSKLMGQWLSKIEEDCHTDIEKTSAEYHLDHIRCDPYNDHLFKYDDYTTIIYISSKTVDDTLEITILCRKETCISEY